VKAIGLHALRGHGDFFLFYYDFSALILFKISIKTFYGTNYSLYLNQKTFFIARTSGEPHILTFSLP